MEHTLTLVEHGGGAPTYRPLERVRLTGHAPAGAGLALRDGLGQVYATAQVEGAFESEVMVGGVLGYHRATLADRDGRTLGEVHFRVDARTRIRTDAGGYGEMWDLLETIMRDDRRTLFLHGKAVTFYHPWVRDDMFCMMGYRYWEPEIGLWHEHMLERQAPDGMMPDYISYPHDSASRPKAFGSRFCRLDKEENVRYDRFPSEADVEYMTVAAIYMAWQATGDDARMARSLPGLERALEYLTTDPMRWSEEHGLVKRPYTIDTWDFKFFGFDREHLKTEEEAQDAVFGVHPDTPMCIMHGDNSGLYQACRQMARMFGALGNEGKRDEYDARAEQVRRNLNKWAWNGRYYDHWVPVTPLGMDQGGVDGCKVLSLSNPYDVNRGLPEHDKCVCIIEEYLRLREELRDTHVAEWVSVHPYWPKGFSGVEGATYVNGGILTIVAGELAKAAFDHGYESYGADILDRVGVWLRRSCRESRVNPRRKDWRMQFPSTYEPSGETSDGIPDAWAHGCVLSAMMRGLCGLVDESKLFNDVQVRPRWVAAGVGKADVTARYGASDGYVAYRFTRGDDCITLDVTGSGRGFRFGVLLPEGTRPTQVTYAGEPVAFQSVTVEDSPYAEFQLDGPLCGAVEIQHENAN